jgi:hypothetical protein
MDRDSSLAHTAARTLFAAVLAIALGYAASAPAQSPAAGADDASAGAAPAADQPRRARDRRRAAESGDETRAPEAAAVPETLPTHTVTTTSTAQVIDDVEARMVCKNIKLTGTKIARRICGTQEQWASMEKRTSDNAQEGMRQMRDRSTVVTSQPQSPLGGGNAGLGGAN